MERTCAIGMVRVTLSSLVILTSSALLDSTMPVTLLPSRICTVACGPVVGVLPLQAVSAKSRTRIEAAFIGSPPCWKSTPQAYGMLAFLCDPAAYAPGPEAAIESSSAQAQRP